MRQIWKGYLRASMVAIPINMYNATSKRTISFHLLHTECKSRIKEQRSCPVCNKVLTNDEIVRGYQYGKESHVVVTDEDIQKARKERSETIDIIKFVDDPQIPPIYFEDAHYLAPDGKVGIEPFAVFHRAMIEENKVALARMVLRNREHLLAIRPYNGTLIAYTLHFAEEVVPASEIDRTAEVKTAGVDATSLNMAKTLMQHMTGEFRPEEYADEYTRTLMDIIKARVEGQEVQIEPAPKAKVINFMDALKKSLQETEKKPAEASRKEMATAGKRKSPAPKRRKAAHA